MHHGASRDASGRTAPTPRSPERTRMMRYVTYSPAAAGTLIRSTICQSSPAAVPAWKRRKKSRAPRTNGGWMHHSARATPPLVVMANKMRKWGFGGLGASQVRRSVRCDDNGGSDGQAVRRSGGWARSPPCDSRFAGPIRNRTVPGTAWARARRIPGSRTCRSSRTPDRVTGSGVGERRPRLLGESTNQR